MLAVHWTPVSNTKSILKNGIRKSKNGVYCFPLTGNKFLDKWWLNFFNQASVRPRKKYNGIVFRITKEDLPAYFGHWVGATNRDSFKKEIADLKSLGKEYREALIWRIGEHTAWRKNYPNYFGDQAMAEKVYMELGHQAIESDSFLFSDLGLMLYTFEDYQIALSHSIPARRIVKVLPQGDEFGRVLRKKKKYRDILSQCKHRKTED